MPVDLLDLAVIGGGLLVLLGLALLIGFVDSEARADAWVRIARARCDLYARERELLECLSSARCRNCPTWRHLRDLPRE